MPAANPSAPPPVDWCATDLTAPGAVTLRVGGRDLPVVQFSASFALNEVPTCACVVAVGRLASSPGAAAASPAHAVLGSLRPQAPATVVMRPRGYAAAGRPWPGDAQVVFDGRYVGFGLKRSGGKLFLVLHLTHWLADLQSSSTLSRWATPASPEQLTDPAVFPAPAPALPGLPASRPDLPPSEAAGASGPPSYLPQLAGVKDLPALIGKDLWVALKTLLCGLAQRPRPEPGGGASCGDALGDNTLALDALRRVEGRGAGCDGPAGRHVPLSLQALADKGVPQVANAIYWAVQDQPLAGWAHATFWDALVGVFCPMFNLAVVPRVRTAVVAADTPAYRTPYKTVDAAEEDGFDVSGLNPWPLGGVGVYGGFVSLAGAATGTASDLALGGCYAPKSASAVPGAVHYVAAPAWLAGVGYMTPPDDGDAVPTGTTPAAPGKKASGSDWRDAAGKLFDGYARAVYVANALRHRSGALSGRLRFDVCPGTVLRVRTRAERFLGWGTRKGGPADELAVDVYGQVNRVTVAVNAETGSAGTTFQLTHLRTAAENSDDRTSTADHPLFGAKVFNGAPLVDGWDL